MVDSVQNNPQSADSSGETAPVSSDNDTGVQPVFALAAELGPNGLPINPPDGDPGEQVEASFIMDTFFGDGQAAAPDKNSGGDQGQGSTPSDGQSKQGSLAPPQAAPAANGEEGSPAQPGPSSTQQPGQQQAGEEGAASQTPSPAQPAADEQQPSAPQLSAEDRLRLASADALARQNEQLIARLRQLEGAQQPAPTGTQPQGQSQPGPQPQPGEQPAQPGVVPVEQLRLVVPDDLFAAVMSEDEPTAKQAMGVLVTAVAQNAAKAALALVPGIVDQRVAAVTQAMETDRQIKSMEESYYTAFPAHKNPMFSPLIQQETEETYKQFPHAPWNADMINAVGAKVNAKLTALGINPVAMANGTGQEEGQGQQQPNGNGGQQPSRRRGPAPMLDTTTSRGGPGGTPQDAGDFIASTFG